MARWPVRPHFLFLIAAHVVAAWTLLTSFSVAGLAAVLVMHFLFGCLGITLGYHRLLTHRSFAVPPFLERFFSVMGALALQGDAIEWVTVHRQHHRFSDGPGDPHDASRGFWFSHAGWIDRDYFPHVTQERFEKYAPDVLRDPFQQRLRRYYALLVAAWIGACWAAAGWQGVAWGLFVRIVFTDHLTWFVNSAGHSFGYRSFETDDLSTNCLWSALTSWGEGWHNNHHAHPSSARHGLAWWELDVTWLLIRGLEKAGLATAVRLPAPEAAPGAAPVSLAALLGLTRRKSGPDTWFLSLSTSKLVDNDKNQVSGPDSEAVT